MSLLADIAYWSSNQWNVLHLYDCFKATHPVDKKSWENKFTRNILFFYLSLDVKNRAIFDHYLEIQLKNYSGTTKCILLADIAYWSFNQWTSLHLYNCFNATNPNGKKYWDNKFNRDILLFYLSLDVNNRQHFDHYMEIQLQNYNWNSRTKYI